MRGRPPWLRFLREFTHFFALILWVAAALAFFAESRNPGEGMWQLVTAILTVIVINGVFSFWQEYRAELAIEALRRLLPQQVKVIRDGQLQEIAIGIIVANVPEGLLPTVTLAHAMATQRMARRNARHCHTLKRGSRDGRQAWLGDPMEIALAEFAGVGDDPGDGVNDAPALKTAHIGTNRFFASARRITRCSLRKILTTGVRHLRRRTGFQAVPRSPVPVRRANRRR